VENDYPELGFWFYWRRKYIVAQLSVNSVNSFMSYGKALFG
jgi:hypothetical protein